MDKLSVSIIICCYNSALKIKPTLNYISRLDISNIEVELIVVDNASVDNTSTVVKECWDVLGSPFMINIVEEPRQGLANARIKGFQCSSNDILLFCDDDNWPDVNYLKNGLKIFEEFPNVGIVGGEGVPVFEIQEVPEVVLRNIEQYAVGPQSSKSGIITNQAGYVYGACIFIRRLVLKQLYDSGFKFEMIGRKGQSLFGGEDIELCLRSKKMGWDIYYESTLRFQHFLTKDRLTETYLVKLNIDSSYSSVFLWPLIFSFFKNKYWKLNYNYFVARQVFSLMKSIIVYLFNITFQNKLNISNDLATLKALLENKKKIISQINFYKSFK